MAAQRSNVLFEPTIGAITGNNPSDEGAGRAFSLHHKQTIDDFAAGMHPADPQTGGKDLRVRTDPDYPAFLIERGESLADRLDGLVRNARLAVPTPTARPAFAAS